MSCSLLLPVALCPAALLPRTRRLTPSGKSSLLPIRHTGCAAGAASTMLLPALALAGRLPFTSGVDRVTAVPTKGRPVDFDRGPEVLDRGLLVEWPVEDLPAAAR